MLNLSSSISLTGPLVSPEKANCYLSAMTTVKDIRRRNLLAILDHQFEDSQAQLAARLEVEPSYVSQLVAGGDNGGRNIGDRTARKIEERVGKPNGWMDSAHGPVTASEADVTYVTKKPVTITQVDTPGLTSAVPPVTFSIPLLEIEASMGIAGRVQPEHETILGQLELNEHFVRTHLPNASSSRNIRLITGSGDSMQGTYEDGDPLFVDVGVTDFQADATYAFTLNRHFYVKRLQRLADGGIRIKSDNSRYDPIDLANPEREDFRIVGRVLGIWNWKKM